MSITSYIFGILASLITLAVVIEMLRRRRLRERHAIWWLIAGLLALVVGVFPATLVWAANLVGVQVPTNLVFFVSIAILFLVCIQHSAELTQLEEQTRTLAEKLALQEMRIRRAESHLPPGTQPGSDLSSD
ncbi:DUF2304 domain-containing protein [Rathayibacter soli]|uniref:DUF2304 domain-containing protein n=1 Tax=Rathayibacter soli TaxID=3144168 RepID=UPI0027E5A3D1|nr:DUF2304 domain-containing protein [Glaciibacter superstes]